MKYTLSLKSQYDENEIKTLIDGLRYDIRDAVENIRNAQEKLVELEKLIEPKQDDNF